MAEHIAPLDVSNSPELLRLAEEVHRSHEARVLRHEGEDLALVVPLPKTGTNAVMKPTEADKAAFRAAAGSWSDIDGEELKRYLYQAREEGTRPRSPRLRSSASRGCALNFAGKGC